MPGSCISTTRPGATSANRSGSLRRSRGGTSIKPDGVQSSEIIPNYKSRQQRPSSPHAISAHAIHWNPGRGDSQRHDSQHTCCYSRSEITHTNTTQHIRMCALSTNQHKALVAGLWWWSLGRSSVVAAHSRRHFVIQIHIFASLGNGSMALGSRREDKRRCSKGCLICRQIKWVPPAASVWPDGRWMCMRKMGKPNKQNDTYVKYICIYIYMYVCGGEHDVGKNEWTRFDLGGFFEFTIHRTSSRCWLRASPRILLI